MRTFSRSAHHRVVVVALACSGLVAACVDDEPGISSSVGAAGDSANAEAGAGAGAESTSSAGKPGSSTGGSAVEQGGSPGDAGANEGGGAPRPPVGTGGDSERGGAPPESEEGGAGGAGEKPVTMSCVFHTPAPATEPAEGGAGSALAADIVVAQSPFIGAYLTDSAGRTLYTYGSDLPGDCETAPISRCVTPDCLDSWPIFSGGERVLGAGLDDAAFGTFTHSNGTPQVTYHGWPLYYYKLDLNLGQLTGQGKGKTWHVAEASPPAVVIMKAGTVKYLADGAGHTLYVSANDTVGNLLDPISRCEGACLDQFIPFRDNRLSVVSSLEPQDFSVFLRPGGGLQLAYKGLPLYLASADAHAGDMHGTETAGFSAALP